MRGDSLRVSVAALTAAAAPPAAAVRPERYGRRASALQKRANLAQPVIAPEEQGADVRLEVAHPVGFAFAEWSRLFAILVVV